jgi:hypothetical protein|nr:MAG TPA: hypothetical protein [Bacteriophage sp.]
MKMKGEINMNKINKSLEAVYTINKYRNECNCA